MLVGLSATTPFTWLFTAYVIFGIGFGLVNAPITNAAVSGMPRAQAGVAAAIASTSRQIGSTLGVAVTGSLVSASLPKGSHVDFALASRAGWWVLAGCGAVVLILGLVATTAWARATAQPHGRSHQPRVPGGTRRMTKASVRRDRAASEAWQAMADLVLNNERRREVSEEVGLSFGKIRALRRIARRPMPMSELAVPPDRRSAQPDPRRGRPGTSRTGGAPATSHRPAGEARRGDAEGSGPGPDGRRHPGPAPGPPLGAPGRGSARTWCGYWRCCRPIPLPTTERRAAPGPERPSGAEDLCPRHRADPNGAVQQPLEEFHALHHPRSRTGEVRIGVDGDDATEARQPPGRARSAGACATAPARSKPHGMKMVTSTCSRLISSQREPARAGTGFARGPARLPPPSTWSGTQCPALKGGSDHSRTRTRGRSCSRTRRRTASTRARRPSISASALRRGPRRRTHHPDAADHVVEPARVEGDHLARGTR